MADPESFGQQLKRYRKAARLSRQELARQAGISPNTIGDLERGVTRGAQHDTVERLARTLGLSGDERTRFTSAVDRRRAPRTRSAQTQQLGSLVPWPLTPLIGREAEMDALRTQLTEAGMRLMTVIGPAGVGKTRLALAAAQELRPHFAHGAIFVSLAPLRDPSLLLSTLAHAVGVREGPGRSMHDALVDVLHERHLLLLLDNCEHLLPALSQQLAPLLEACPGVVVLATSRSPLHLRGEHEVLLDPLVVPPLSLSLNSDALGRVPSVTLFIECACRVRPDFQLTQATAPAVAEICRRLDGLPLAIELAAAHTKLLEPDALAARLEQRLPLLVGGPYDLPQCQQTLRDALAWSYDLLSASAQDVFARISVFAGGCTLEAAAVVCVSPHDPGGDVLSQLRTLVDQSLVQSVPIAPGEIRLVLLETMREFAGDCLVRQGQDMAAGEAHNRYFLALAEAADEGLRRPREEEWLARLDREHDNLRSVLRRLEAHGDGPRRLRLVGALWRFWYVRGHLVEGRHWVESVLAASQELPTDPAAHTTLRAAVLDGAGIIAWSQGDVDRAAALYGESLTLYERLNDVGGRIDVLSDWGQLLYEQGDHEQAGTRFREGFQLAQEAGHSRRVALLCLNLGHLALDKGDYPGAATLYTQGLELWRDLGSTRGVSNSLLNLGRVQAAQKDNSVATRLYHEALLLMRALGDQRGLAFCLEGMAGLAVAGGHATHAVQLCGVAARLRTEVGAPAPPPERRPIEQTITAARSILGDAAFAAAWAQSQTLSVDQTITLVQEHHGLSSSHAGIPDLADPL